MPVLEGTVNEQKVQVLRDTGCSGVVVKRKFIAEEQLTGEMCFMAMMNNTVVEAPIAIINIDTPYYVGEVRAMCLADALYDLVIGNIPHVRGPEDPDREWCAKGGVATRSGKRKKGETPLKLPQVVDDLNVDRESLIKMQQEDQSLKEHERRGEGRRTRGMSNVSHEILTESSIESLRMSILIKGNRYCRSWYRRR